MENRSNVWNFDETNTEVKVSLFGKFVLIALAITFLVVPLHTINPETFTIVGWVKSGWDCFSLSLLN
jgi:hypothetical protein